ncbi:cytochrome c [Sporosarcina thermotolerans]|uniref:Cytochrome c n=1 Tax=Sporosarcina thermotolerans TaxID=633404 RepID=A0AAW9A7K3_9BACL|nr:cytochrome c [Sporosarcina thermotolerans]MDW0117372.1 cytochrome c [Sporosarcina thermotolerans]WHT47514.1 cytochrome c [Sporosarcina thermotolerans]
MKSNPVVPYILIFALGLGLIFFMSLYGLDQKKEIAGAGEEGQTETDVATSEDFDPESFTQGQCVSCHGGDLSGGFGPTLHGLTDKEAVHDIIKNGVGSMPAFGSKLSDEQIDQLTDYLLTLK